jgi:hypothetical protein
VILIEEFKDIVLYQNIKITPKYLGYLLPTQMTMQVNVLNPNSSITTRSKHEKCPIICLPFKKINVVVLRPLSKIPSASDRPPMAQRKLAWHPCQAHGLFSMTSIQIESFRFTDFLALDL